jgi:nicotinamide-nucleotide amidase
VSHDDAALDTLAAEIGAALAARGWRLATAESCTGGWIAKTATDIAGSSVWFDSAAVTYSNAAKTRDLGVPAAVIETYGAVSEPVVRAMVDGLRERTGCEAGIAVSGIAGPDGATADKPLGLVWFAWSVGRKTEASSRIFDGDREAVRRAAVAVALIELSRLIQAASP